MPAPIFRPLFPLHSLYKFRLSRCSNKPDRLKDSKRFAVTSLIPLVQMMFAFYVWLGALFVKQVQVTSTE